MDTLLVGNIAAFICVLLTGLVISAYATKRVLKDNYNKFLEQKSKTLFEDKKSVLINCVILILFERVIFNIVVGGVYLTSNYEHPFLYIKLANLVWLAYILFEVCLDYVNKD